jgi:DNA gyrase subunit B
VTATGRGIGPEFDIEKLRYHRIIVMTEADDGSHSHAAPHLLLPADEGAVDAAHLRAVPPLYRVKIGKRALRREGVYFEELSSASARRTPR